MKDLQHIIDAQREVLSEMQMSPDSFTAEDFDAVSQYLQILLLLQEKELELEEVKEKLRVAEAALVATYTDAEAGCRGKVCNGCGFGPSFASHQCSICHRMR